MATTAITDETPMRIPSTVRKDRSLLARREARAMAMASEKGIPNFPVLKCAQRRGAGAGELRARVVDRAHEGEPPSPRAFAALPSLLGIAFDLPVADADGAIRVLGDVRFVGHEH